MTTNPNPFPFLRLVAPLAVAHVAVASLADALYCAAALRDAARLGTLDEARGVAALDALASGARSALADLDDALGEARHAVHAARMIERERGVEPTTPLGLVERLADAALALRDVRDVLRGGEVGGRRVLATVRRRVLAHGVEATAARFLGALALVVGDAAPERADALRALGFDAADLVDRGAPLREAIAAPLVVVALRALAEALDRLGVPRAERERVREACAVLTGAASPTSPTCSSRASLALAFAALAAPEASDRLALASGERLGERLVAQRGAVLAELRDAHAEALAAE